MCMLYVLSDLYIFIATWRAAMRYTFVQAREKCLFTTGTL